MFSVCGQLRAKDYGLRVCGFILLLAVGRPFADA